jgi:(p)ppGpp synthase/HD superfamily hydrolase
MMRTKQDKEEYTQLLKAINLAFNAHEGQYRKDGKTEYIFHPLFVMLHVSSLKAKTVAVLHDVLEDTAVMESELRKNFDKDVVDAVVLLTKKPKEVYMDYIRKIQDNELAREVKIADIKHNLSGMTYIPNDKEREYLKCKYHGALSYLAVTNK